LAGLTVPGWTAAGGMVGDLLGSFSAGCAMEAKGNTRAEIRIALAKRVMGNLRE